MSGESLESDHSPPSHGCGQVRAGLWLWLRWSCSVGYKTSGGDYQGYLVFFFFSSISLLYPINTGKKRNIEKERTTTMRFNVLLPLAAASVVLANPQPQPNPVAAPAPQSTDSGLLTELPIILSGAQDLLSQPNIDNLNLIIGNAAKLLSNSNLNILQDILNNAHALLTPGFVDNTTVLIADATPVSLDHCFHMRGQC